MLLFCLSYICAFTKRCSHVHDAASVQPNPQEPQQEGHVRRGGRRSCGRSNRRCGATTEREVVGVVLLLLLPRLNDREVSCTYA
jgi:hypothetical protein